VSNVRFDWRWVAAIVVIAVLAGAGRLPWYVTTLVAGGSGIWLLAIGWQAWVRSGGPPSRGRVTYWRGQVRQIILTGGVGPGDTTSEAAAGKQYLIGHGMAADALLLEEQGATTWESLRNAVPLAHTNRIGAVLLVSDPFHMLRSLKMARDLGLVAYGSPTRTSPISGSIVAEVRYVVRESWAYLLYLFVRQ